MQIRELGRGEEEGEGGGAEPLQVLCARHPPRSFCLANKERSLTRPIAGGERFVVNRRTEPRGLGTNGRRPPEKAEGRAPDRGGEPAQECRGSDFFLLLFFFFLQKTLIHRTDPNRRVRTWWAT